MADKIPSNKDVKRTAENIKGEIETTKMETEGLSRVGEKLLDDTKKVVDSAEKLMLEKDLSKQLKKVAKEGEKASQELQENLERLKRMQADTIQQIDTEEIRKLAMHLLDTSRLAAREIMTSPAFRKSLGDLITLLGDIIHVEDVSEESMDVDVDLRREGEKLKSEAKGAARDIKSSETLDEAARKAQKKGRELAGKAQEKGRELAGKAQEVGQETKKRTEKPAQRLMRGEGDQSRNIKETVEGAVNPVLEGTGAGKRVRLSKQQLDQLWDRFSTLAREIAERDRSKRVYDGIFELLRLVRDQARGVSDRTGEQLRQVTDELRNSKHLRRTLELSQEMFESFTNKRLDHLIRNANAIIEKFNSDDQLRGYFGDLSNYMSRIIDQPRLLTEDATRRQGRRLIKRGRRLQDQKIYGHIEAISNELRELVDAIEKDPATMRLRESLRTLVSDLMLDSEGNFVYKPEVLEQLKRIILDSIVDRLRVPLPTISGEGQDLDFEVSGLVLNVSDVIPERVLIESRGKLLLDPKQMEIEGAAHGLRITMNNINIHMPEARLWFRRKSFPKVEDEGRASIDVGGRGMDLVIVLRTIAKPPNFFRVQAVDCNFHNLALTLSETRHDIIYNSLLKMFSGTVKNDIENAIEDNIRGNLEQLNLLLRDQWERSHLSGKPLQETIRSGVEKVQQTLGTMV